MGGRDVSTAIDTTAIPTGNWTFDPTHSSVGFTVVYMRRLPW